MSDAPLRILHYLPRIRLEEGGVVRAVLDLCSLLAEHGHAVDLLTHDAADAPQAWTGGDRAPQIRLIEPRGPLRALLPAGAWRAAQESVRSADIVHLHTPWEPANIALARAARRGGVPYILTIHGMLDDWSMRQSRAKKRLYLALVARRLLERAAAVHCTAQAEMTQSRKWFPRGRAVVAPLVFDTQPFHRLPGPGEARQTFNLRGQIPVVLFLSRLHYKKGVEILVDAFTEPPLRDTDALLLIAGTGDEQYARAIQARIEKAGLADRARLVGHVGGSLKLSLYEAADVFALPTSQENFGFVLPESLACGTPAVTTKGVDIWPELEESGGAEVVPRDAASFARAIRGLLDEPARRERMGKAGRRWTLQRLDPAQVVGDYETMYRKAIT